jgi:RecB family exonuclease
MPYSYSQLQSYKTCPLKYRFEKIDKLPTPPSESLHLILGTSVHEVLEELYNQVNDLKQLEKSALLSLFKNVRERELTKVADIVGRNPFDEETVNTFFTRGTSYIVYYYDKFFPFTQAVPMKTEMRVAFSIEEGIDFMGKIDRLDLLGSKMIINDYKTNRSLPKDSDNTIEDQITLYSIGILQEYGQQIDEISGRVIYLHLQTEHERVITEEKIAKVKAKYLPLMQEIEQRKADYAAGNEEAFPYKAGYACNECGCKQLCPLYKHQYATDETVELADLGQTSIRKLIEKYALLRDQEKYYAEEKKLIGTLLSDFAKEKGYKTLYGESKKLSVMKKLTFSPVKEKLSALEGKLSEKAMLDEVLAIDSNKL